MDNSEITGQIIKAAYAVYNRLGKGFLEKVYQNAMFIELTEMELDVVKELPIEVFYKRKNVGVFYADLMVEGHIVVELKAVEHLAPIHEVQLVNYLNGSGLKIGLLINFGDKVEVKRKYDVVRSQKSEVRRQKTEDSSQKTVVRRQV